MKKCAFFIVLLSIWFSACSPQPGSEFTRNHEKWQVADIQHYRYELFVGCFCAFTQRMPLSIEIQDGRMVSMSYNDGSPVPPEEQGTFAQYQTIDALFDYTEASAKKADQIQVQYDPTYGFPSAVQIDFIQNAADDELSLSVENFKPLQ